MFKIAYGAGHDLLEAGKNFEWHLNERVARYFADATQEYEDTEILRTDDPTGETEVRLGERCRRANDFDADVAISMHHNAGAGNTSAGGIMAYTHPNASAKSVLYRDAIYDCCVDATGLMGNRASPKTAANLYVLRNTKMPAVLMEYGFMDSTVDRSIIDTEDFARKVAYATMEGIARVAGLKKRSAPPAPAPVPETVPEPVPQTEDGYTLEDFIRDIQNAAEIPIDGIAGNQTLNSTVTVSARKNSDSRMVLPIQKRLKALGFYTGILDGKAEGRFDAALKAYQKSIGAITDGEATRGMKTWRHLLGMV